MLEKGKISCAQTIFLLMNVVGATAVMFLPDIVARQAGRDSWLSFAVAMLPAFFLLAIIYYLQNRFPGLNFIQYLTSAFGKIPGKIIGFFYLFFFIHTTTIIVQEFSELLNTTILPATPSIILQSLMLLLCAYSVRGGLEVLARTFEFLSAVIVVFLVTVLILSFREIELENLLPILEHGFSPVLLGAISPAAFQGEVILLAMIIPFLKNPANGIRCGFLAVVFLGVILIGNAVLITAVLGAGAAKIVFPTFDMIRILGGTEVRVDALIIIIWFAGLFGKISLFYYAIVLGGAQLLNLKDFRPLVFPVGILLAAMTVQLVENTVELARYTEELWPLFAYVFEYILPSIMLCAIWIKGLAARKAKA